MNQLEAFTKARELVAKGWTTEVLARNKYGFEVPPDDHWATCFCASGAVIAAIKSHNTKNSTHMITKCRKLFEEVNGLNYIPPWNDEPERTQEEVVAAFDKVIEVLKS